MADRLSHKRILVTAAAQGIGRAIAIACANESAEVIATDLNIDKLSAELSGVDRVSIRKLDVLDGKDVRDCAGEVGTIDCLMNIAGFVHHGTILDSGEEEWDFGFDLNVKAMYRTIRAFLPAMLENGSGSIVNMSSIASSTKGVPFRCVYGASKAAVLGLTKSVAADFVTRGIRCNAVCPGTVESPSLEERIAAFDDPVEARKAFIARQPMGRLGKPEEIAAMAVYLASDESAYTTGAAMVVDGGMLI